MIVDKVLKTLDILEDAQVFYCVDKKLIITSTCGHRVDRGIEIARSFKKLIISAGYKIDTHPSGYECKIFNKYNDLEEIAEGDCNVSFFVGVLEEFEKMQINQYFRNSELEKSNDYNLLAFFVMEYLKANDCLASSFFEKVEQIEEFVKNAIKTGVYNSEHLEKITNDYRYLALHVEDALYRLNLCEEYQ